MGETSVAGMWTGGRERGLTGPGLLSSLTCGLSSSREAVRLSFLGCPFAGVALDITVNPPSERSDRRVWTSAPEHAGTGRRFSVSDRTVGWTPRFYFYFTFHSRGAGEPLARPVNPLNYLLREKGLCPREPIFRPVDLCG